MDAGAGLIHLLVVIVAAVVGAEVAERLRVPVVVGELIAGFVVGPAALGLVRSDDLLRVLAEVGVVLLLLEVGLEMDLVELGRVGRSALVLAVLGSVLSVAAGSGVAALAGERARAAAFVGAAIAATSVGITARVLGDLRALARVEARTVLGAAVADDVLGLCLLAVAARLAAGGSVGALSVAGVAGKAIAFLVVATLVSVRLAPSVLAGVSRHARSTGTLVLCALALTLALSVLARAAGLAPLIGAFVAGLALARTDEAEAVGLGLGPLARVLVPVFFLQVGIDADPAALARPGAVALAAGLLVAAVGAKVAAAALTPGVRGDRLLVGLGMLPRGEVLLVFAGIGLHEGILGADVHAALVVVVLGTTLATGPLLRWRLGREPDRPAS